MAAVAFAPFGGLVPRADPLTIPTGGAQIASHCRLTAGGILEAFKLPSQVFSSGFGPFNTIYRFGQAQSTDTEYWFTSKNAVDFVKGAIANDTEERTFYTGDGHPKVTNAALATASLPYPTAFYRLGLPPPSNPLFTVVSGTPASDTSVIETRFYVYTYVGSMGEESAPSELSEQLTMSVGQVVTLYIQGLPNGAYNTVAKRIYRTSTGNSSTAFLFVAEVASSTGAYEDSILAENLGEPIPSTTYSQLPDLARGLVSLPNGMMAAHTDYDVYFSEPFKPYAWPEGYIQTVDFPIVGLGVFGTALVVLTKGFPYIMDGSDPLSMSSQKLAVPYACVSKKSIVSSMNGVIYAAADGLILIDANGPKVLTEALFTRREWELYNPSSMVCAIWDEKIFMFYDTLSVQGGLILDVQAGLTTTDVYATSAFTDPVTNSLFLGRYGTITKWDGGTAGTYTWKSRKLNMPLPRNFAYGQVLADNYPVTALLYADDALVHTQTVVDDKPFRLPGGFRARYWELTLVGTGKVFSAYLADTTMDLQSV